VTRCTTVTISAGGEVTLGGGGKGGDDTSWADVNFIGPKMKKTQAVDSVATNGR
jgi:hypothetical protein